MDDKSETKSPKEKKVSWRNPAIRRMCYVGLSAALMCVLSPISIPLEPISITLATLALYLIGALLDWKWSSLAILLYLLLGMAGLPVFSKYQGGFAIILGPTGGFLMGYLPGVMVEGLLLTKWGDKKWLYPIAMIVATFIIYGAGVLWFTLYCGKSFAVAMSACVIPFLPLDALKIAVASLLGIRLRPTLSKLDR